MHVFFFLQMYKAYYHERRRRRNEAETLLTIRVHFETLRNLLLRHKQRLWGFFLLSDIFLFTQDRSAISVINGFGKFSACSISKVEKLRAMTLSLPLPFHSTIQVPTQHMTPNNL